VAGQEVESSASPRTSAGEGGLHAGRQGTSVVEVAVRVGQVAQTLDLDRATEPMSLDPTKLIADYDASNLDRADNRSRSDNT
jgi:hypothetical protein